MGGMQDLRTIATKNLICINLLYLPTPVAVVVQDWALGMSRVFLRAGQLKALEDLRSAGRLHQIGTR